MAQDTVTKAAPVSQLAKQVDTDSLSQFGGAGREKLSRNEIAIPYLLILQDLSPQVKKSDPKYIKGAEAGMVLNSVTNEVYNTTENPLRLIPCHLLTQWTEWKSRKEGGGLVARHTTERDAHEKMKSPNNEICITCYYSMMMLSKENELVPVILSLAKTQFKVAKQFNSWWSQIKGKDSEGKPFYMPIFGHHYAWSTKLENNAQGSWFGWQFKDIGQIPEPKWIKTLSGVYQDASKQFALPASAVEEESAQHLNADLPF